MELDCVPEFHVQALPQCQSLFPVVQSAATMPVAFPSVWALLSAEDRSPAGLSDWPIRLIAAPAANLQGSPALL